jgi:hypothetical protein
MNYQPNGPHFGQKKLLTTMTGEIIQPVRVYYKVKDKELVEKALFKLKCMDFDSKNNRFVWLYKKEAKKLKFNIPATEIPATHNPLVLGHFRTSEADEIYLETRSFERALAAIPFFDKHLKRYMAEITDITIINKLFSNEDDVADFDRIFSNEIFINPEEKLAEMKKMIEQGDVLTSILAGENRSQLPLAERFPSNFYEDGVGSFHLVFQGRQYVAMQHWKGNVDYSLRDYIAMAAGL